MQDFIDTEIDGLERVLAVPTGDLGWGSDLDCTDDITENADELRGDDPEILRQSAYHRVSTERGKLPGDTEEEQNYGIDLLGFVAVGMIPLEVSEAKDKTQVELLKDDRFASVSSNFEFVDLETVEVTIEIEPVEGEPFDLVVAVSNGTALLKATG
jgi:hypothetical protein